jgi:hypothetical protein
MSRRAWRERRRCLPRLVSLLLSVVLALVYGWDGPGSPGRARAGEQARGDDAASGGDRKEDQGEARLDAMRRRLEATHVYALAAGAKTALKPLSGPLFRYSDQPRLILDATLWGWGAAGRPLVMEKIEFYRRPEGQPKWFYCMASLSEGLVEAEWPDGRRWSAKQPGLELRPLPDAPKAADRDFARLLQLKQVARRFSPTISDPAAGWQEQMRLLPRHVCRYSDPDSGVLDGAIFAFATNGTNPDLLLVLELHGRDVSDTAWQYGLARMTAGQVSVRLDQKEVWSVPYVAPPPPKVPAKFDTWLFFFESAG